MAIGGMHPVAHKKHWHIPAKDTQYPLGAKFHIEGDSRDMWLADYNVRVCTTAEVLKQPHRIDKKVYVRISNIDGDTDVCIRIRKDALKPHNRIND